VQPTIPRHISAPVHGEVLGLILCFQTSKHQMVVVMNGTGRPVLLSRVGWVRKGVGEVVFFNIRLPCCASYRCGNERGSATMPCEPGPDDE
jgi:hypothetical protein